MTDLTYVYCLVRARKAPDLSRVPRGLPGTGRPRALAAGAGLWLVVADAPSDRYEEAAIERGLRDLAWVSGCALPHEAVVEHVAASGAVLPMKLFTLFREDARALGHVRKDRARIDRVFARVGGREEWGVRLLLDEQAALNAARSRAAAEAKGAIRGNGTGTGLSFLTRKKLEHHLASNLLARARAEADAIFDELAARSDDAKKRAPPPGEMGKRALLDGAFLVRRGKGRSFAAAARRRAKALDAQGLRLEVTGPWPAYNFIGGAR